MKSLSLATPHAIIMVGIVGSGKTFFASKFAQTFGAPYINEFDIRQYAADEESTVHLVELMIEQATRTKSTIVLEVDSASRTHRTALAKALKDVGYKPFLVWVQTDQATAKSRAAKSSALSSRQFAESLKDFSPPHPSEDALVISGKHTYATQARVVLKKLSNDRPPIKPTTRPEPAPRGNITVR